MRHDPASAAIVIMLRSLKMYGMASVIGGGKGPARATLVNGATSHAPDFDDR